MYFYQPSQGHGLPHDPLNAIIGPRPIGWIASQDAEGQRNLAPYSFFNCFNYRPPIIGFASSGWKDSVRNIVETKEFVWNLATRPLAMAMNETSASIPHDEDEFVRAGLTATASRLVSAPGSRRARGTLSAVCRSVFSSPPPTATLSIRGWCSAKWSPCILMNHCWITASIKPPGPSRSCAPAARAPTTVLMTACVLT